MSTYHLDISAALDVNLNTVASANSIPVAWENVDYKPTVGTLYLRPTLLPADTDPFGTSYDSSLDHLGIYQIDVIAPVDQGKGQAFTKADIIATAFSYGELSYNGVIVTIKSSSPSPGKRDGAWFILPVIISYQSITGN